MHSVRRDTNSGISREMLQWIHATGNKMCLTASCHRHKVWRRLYQLHLVCHEGTRNDVTSESESVILSVSVLDLFLKCHRPKHSFAILKKSLTSLITMFIFNLSQAAYWKVPSNSVSVGHQTGPPFHPSHHLSCLTRDCNIRVCQYLGSRRCWLQRTQFWFHLGQICIAIFSLNSQIYSSCTWG